MMLVAMVFCYAAGIVVPPCFAGRPRAQNVIAHGAAGLASALGVMAGIVGLVAPEPMTASVPSTLPFLAFAIRLDPLAALFLLTIALTGLAVSVYALGYVTEFYGRASLGLLGSLYNAFLASMTLVILADNGFFFLIVWELMSLISYFLVVTEHEKADVRHAGFFYLIMMHIGTAFIILTFLGLFEGTGSFSFEAFRHPQQPLPEGLRTLVFLAALIGFGTKAGIVPLHVWLPRAHPAAPTHISALMSGVMIKTAIYALIRVYFDFLGGQFLWWWGFAVLVIGAISALLGVMYALMEHDLKSLLAFHSVENIGIILLGVGAGMIFLTYGLKEFAALGLLAGLYHTINHAMFKALLFLGAGSLVYATHTRNMEEYGGLLRRMPWTGACFLIGAVSIAALPPTNGFVSEWLVFQSLFLSFHLPALFLKLMLPIAAAMLALTGVLALACFAKAFGMSFLALPRSPHARRAAEAPPAMRIGMAVLALVCAVLGLAPMLVIPLLDRVTGPLVGVSIREKVLALDGWAVAGKRGVFQYLTAGDRDDAGRPRGPCAAPGCRTRRPFRQTLLQDLGVRAQPHGADGVHPDRLCPAHQARVQHHLPTDGHRGDGIAGGVPLLRQTQAVRVPHRTGVSEVSLRSGGGIRVGPGRPPPGHPGGEPAPVSRIHLCDSDRPVAAGLVGREGM